jgi:hypothetical protein
MRFKRKIFVIVISTLACHSCIKQVDVPLRNEKPILVVEGAVTTDSVPYTVKLTYSGPISYSDTIPEEFIERDAIVTIADDEGNTTQLVYTYQGVYETTDPTFIGKVGRSYSVTVLLKDGKKYISRPEKIKSPVPISGLNVSFVNKFDMFLPTYMNVAVNAKDPAAEENYYRWTFYSWIGRQTPGISCGFGNCIIFEYCYQKIIDNEVRILSDASINGRDIVNQTVGRCYIYTYFNPYVDIAQMSMTREAYQFWKLYQDQTARTGGILDPLPAAIKGNVYNAANTTDFALGYFSAASVAHKKVILVPYSITPYLLQLSAQQFIPSQSIACFNYFPNTLSYPPPPEKQYPPPPGWENAEQIKVEW